MSKNLLAAGVVAIVVIIPFLNWWLVSADHVPGAWFATMALISLFCILAGQHVVGRWAGVLIDERNVISLSRFQITLWTIVVLSAFITAAMYNIYSNVDSPLGISIPSQLWLAMGISTASLVGTPLILGQKAQKTPSQAGLEATKLALKSSTGQDATTVTNKGQVIGNSTAAGAAWTDMVTGDETSNGAHLDLAKIQMLLFTVMIVSSYAYAIWRMFGFAQPDGVTAFPALDESAIALLGISHGGYLVNKAVPRDLVGAATK